MKFLNRVGDYAYRVWKSAWYLGEGMGVLFRHMRRQNVVVQYPFEKLILSERYRGRIHFEQPKCISCEICVRVCPIDLPVVDWEFNKSTKKKELNSYSIDFGICILCGNCVEYCPTNCLSMTPEYESAVYDRHELNFDDVALGRLPARVQDDPIVKPLREFAYLPKGVVNYAEYARKHGSGGRRAGQIPQEILEAMSTEDPGTRSETVTPPGEGSPCP
ncbi:NADH-quinone oxidoreductase subunit NuoI [Anthocerotibacter panamensis]|uniref:NADH-quinone oxidoreductase subunit NuoI n=1 Tax=Anthocerotibacter panamensis TaxID=2857077 RepID=UPI001C402DFF|nr:NADH-quinone oxidoreductase subunit NuoI [Anthocerotibacter panamensis]